MGRSYSNCAFVLTLPVLTVTDDYVLVTTRYSSQKDNTEVIKFYKGILSDRLNNTCISMDDQTEFQARRKLASFSFGFLTTKRFWTNGALLTLEFLSNNGEKTIVKYGINDNSPTVLLDVSKVSMSLDETHAYRTIKQKDSKITLDKYINLSSGEEKNTSDKNSKGLSTDTIYGLDEYRNALRAEMAFLRNGGGKKYKVTNGKLISKSALHYYLFDLEAELYIADDAPITLSTGMEQSSGSVIMCEDFQIIVQLESNLGERVGSAYISVEPWKLLDALDKRLEYAITLGKPKIANILMKDGPALATKDSVKKIPKGQDQVIKRALTEPVTIVWGPPGTGKTHTMSEIAIRFIDKGYNVLIVSHSNVSVDGVAKKIDELLRQKGRLSVLKEGTVLRYGYVRDEELSRNPYVSSFYFAVTKNAELKKSLDELQNEYDTIKKKNGIGDPRIIGLRKSIWDIRTKINSLEKYYVSKAQVVATTASKMVIDKDLQDRKFDVVMFDEVSMAYVLQIAAAATFATKHFICVGDFMQLAPIAQSKAQEILCKDIFKHLGINVNGSPYYHPWLVMLDEQRRMHPSIAAFANRYVYQGLLRNHESTLTSRNHIVEAELFEKRPINIVNLASSYCAASKNEDNSRYNILSAVISFCIACNTEESDSVDTVSIITPYAAQTRLIRALVLDYRKSKKTEIRCSTVHQFQGSESDVIVFDAVESYPAKRPGWLMGKDAGSILRLINVAVTRARGKLITVANEKFWYNHYEGTNHTFYQLVKYLKEKGNAVQYNGSGLESLEEMIAHLSLAGGPNFFNSVEQYMTKLEDDIANARGKIVISLPSGKLDSRCEKTIYSWLERAKKYGTRVLVKCNDYEGLPDHWKTLSWKTENATFPIVMIDDHITWYGLPIAPWEFRDGNSGYKTVCHIVFKVNGEHTSEMIRSLADLEYREINGRKSVLLPKGESGEKADPEGPSGLAKYVQENHKCMGCKKPFMLTKGKSGKTILWCKDCRKTELLSPDDLNRYIRLGNVRCPQHNSMIEGKLGRYGLYVKCVHGHYLKVEDI